MVEYEEFDRKYEEAIQVWDRALLRTMFLGMSPVAAVLVGVFAVSGRNPVTILLSFLATFGCIWFFSRIIAALLVDSSIANLTDADQLQVAIAACIQRGEKWARFGNLTGLIRVLRRSPRRTSTI